MRTEGRGRRGRDEDEVEMRRRRDEEAGEMMRTGCRRDAGGEQ